MVSDVHQGTGSFRPSVWGLFRAFGGRREGGQCAHCARCEGCCHSGDAGRLHVGHHRTRMAATSMDHGQLTLKTSDCGREESHVDVRKVSSEARRQPMKDSTWHAFWQGSHLVNAMEWTQMYQTMRAVHFAFVWREERESTALAAFKSWAVRKRGGLEHVHDSAATHPRCDRSTGGRQAVDEVLAEVRRQAAASRSPTSTSEPSEAI